MWRRGQLAPVASKEGAIARWAGLWGIELESNFVLFYFKNHAWRPTSSALASCGPFVLLHD